jgi:asparagine synthase (glutamine-hydrolysing)
MCGIYGYIGLENDDVLKKMSECLRHRGPDAFGFWSDNANKIHLGQNRLSIIDLSISAKQPLFNEDGSVVLVFNGEIYNFQELREELLAKGHTFISHTDSEVLVHLYEEEGVNMLSRIRGMFAFVIYDRNKQQTFVARDHFGIKPLYYFNNENHFAFASEMKALQQHPAVEFSVNPKAVLDHLSFLWCPFPKTMASDVMKLEPGTAMILEGAKVVKKWNFYDVPYTGKYVSITEEQAVEELDKLLEESIAEQLVSDVPVGIFLSGGVDSSLIAAYVRKLRKDQPIKAFTIDVQGGDMEGNPNDLPYARRVAKDLNIDLEEIIVTPSEILKHLEELTYILDEPLADPAAINVMLITKIAREKGYIVLLSGAGGDDVFSGYRRHQAMQMDLKLFKLPAFVRKAMEAIGKNIPIVHPKIRKARKYLRHFGASLNDRLVSYYYWMDEISARELLTPSFKQKVKEYSASKNLEASFSNIPDEKEALNKMLYIETKFFLVDHNLNYTDKMSMYNSIETRVPFLDYRIANFAAALPVELKVKNGHAKYILKKVAEKYLHKDIVYRKKTGFGAPLRQWVKSDFKVLFETYLNKEILEKHGVFDHAQVAQLLKDNYNAKVDAAYTIFGIVCMTIWMERYCK